MSLIEYHCKMCGSKGSVELNCSAVEMQELGFGLQFWTSMLVCNRCGDFRIELRRITDAVFKLCRVIELSRFQSETRRKEVAERVKEKLIAWTKRYIGMLSVHFRQPNYWDAALVDELIATPEKAQAQLAIIYRTMRAGKWANTELSYGESQ